jgi:hypothetical protein
LDIYLIIRLLDTSAVLDTIPVDVLPGAVLLTIVRDVPLSELSIFQWKGTCVGATSAHYVTDKEWNYSMFYLYTNMVEVETF